MGYYINPSDQSKEVWLVNNGRLLTKTPENYRDGDDIAVCLVDNGPFTAAAVAFSQAELEYFKSPADPRPKLWFMVPLDKLIEVRAVNEGLIK